MKVKKLELAQWSLGQSRQAEVLTTIIMLTDEQPSDHQSPVEAPFSTDR
jgi:hypothetical protein